MSIERMMKTPCLILRRQEEDEEEEDALGNPVLGEPEEDALGNPVLGEPEEVETVCAFQQRDRDEPKGAGETSDTLWDLFLPNGTEIDTGDAVVVKGRRYEMVGDPWDADEGSRSLWHVAATVRRVAGSGDHVEGS